MRPKRNYGATGYGLLDGSVIAVNGVSVLPPAPVLPSVPVMFSGGGTEPGPNRS